MAHYQRIRDLREDSDKTQAEIAKLLQTTAQYYGKYESGERELPFSRAIKLADIYGVTLDYLAGRTNVSAAPVCDISEEEMNFLMQYRALSERSKGKAELFMEQLLKRQSRQ